MTLRIFRKERHARELKRQQDVLQRRMALMERDNARKKVVVMRNNIVGQCRCSISLHALDVF